MKNLGIYLHIPFCIQKCNYCGFYSRGGSDESERSRYVEGLLFDIEEYGRVYGNDYTVDTVFIGGGTPSILEGEDIIKISDGLRAAFDFDERIEFTVEANPKTLTEAKLGAYRAAGVNRLSIGLQSWNDGLLKTLGRVHTSCDFLENYEMARRLGFDNVNVDLMFAFPGHTAEIWEDTLDRVIDIEPEHVSFYSMQLEEGTPFFEAFQAGRLEQIPDEIDREMYHLALKKFRAAGYDHYEISNCGREGYECRHNLKYWSFQDYLGIGEGASSFIGGCRFTEGSSAEFHQNTFADDVSEYTFTALRKRQGVDFRDFRRRFGREFWDVFAQEKIELEPFLKLNQVEEDFAGLRLTEEGIDVSNGIMAIFV